MYPDFEKHQRNFRRIAKDSLGNAPQIPAAEVAQAITEAAQERGTPERTQETNLERQILKQRIMAELEEKLALLDNPFYRPEKEPDARQVSFDGKTLWWDKPDGTSVRISRGALLTDGDWGINYQLDTNSAPRLLRKKYLIEQAKRELRRLQFAQIVEDALASTKVPDSRKHSFKWHRENLNRDPGYIAERMVENFIKKLMFNHNLEFELISATPYEDVEQKIDFYIRRRNRYRGVGVKEVPEKNLGIQFTIGRTAGGKNEKIRKAKEVHEEDLKRRHVDDIVLIKFPLRDAEGAMKTWKNLGNPPGGPDELWNDGLKQRLLRTLLSGIMSPEEIDQAWQAIQQEKQLRRL